MAKNKKAEETEEQSAEQQAVEQGETCSADRHKADVSSKASRRLEVVLTDSEIADKARKQAELIHDRQGIEYELADAKKRFGDRIKGISQEVDEIGEEIYKGVVTRPVDCLIEKHFDNGLLVVIRMDTDQVIEERSLTADELAVELDLWLELDDTGDLLDEAERFVRETQRASATMLQRKFGMGVNCAETIIIELAQRGVLGVPDADGVRPILEIKDEEPEVPVDPQTEPAENAEKPNPFMEMFEKQVAETIAMIKAHGRINTASIQRKLNVGYSRAVKVMEELEDRGVVGPARDGQPREILIAVDPQPVEVVSEETVEKQEE